MASITRFPFVSRLRAESNQYILHYTGGRVTRRGPGISYWYVPMWAAVAQVPVEDIETTFLLKERSADFQDVSVQVTLVYRFSDYAEAASRINFSISLSSGAWLEPPLERLANFWMQRAKTPAREYLVSVPVVEAVGKGPAEVRAKIEAALREDAEVAAMGMELVSLQVIQITPNAEVEKAIQTPTREAIQQKADEAMFARRALAVEKERAIKENELATEIELAKRQEQLIQRQGDNQLLTVRQEAAAAKEQLEAEVERGELQAESTAKQNRIRAQGEADAKRMVAEALAEGEQRRVSIYAEAPRHVPLGLGLMELADNIDVIQHLNITPDLIGSTFEQFVRDQGSKAE